MLILTSRQMFAAESMAVARGGTFLDLMERAGQACTDILIKEYGIQRNDPRSILVLVGKGKNGGDGYVIARLLKKLGGRVTILTACGAPRAADAVTMAEKAAALAIPTVEYTGDPAEIQPLLNGADLIVEAIFGSGFRGALEEPLQRLACAVNACGKPVVAIDVPAGADCDKAIAEGPAFQAAQTIAIAAHKPIHILKPWNRLCGKTLLAKIGILPEELTAACAPQRAVYSPAEIAALLPERSPVSNKGTYGHALCICGSRTMIGAAVLSVKGALRSGAGLVTAAFPDAAYHGIAPQLTESLLLPLPSAECGSLSADALPMIRQALNGKYAVLLGCGLGWNSDTAALVSALLHTCEIPLILDADGINALGGNINELKKAAAPCVLTPHPGEMARLTGKSIQEILVDPMRIATDFAREYGVTVLLKGANTVICDGARTVINCTGNDGLAKGGSGDWLAGLLTGLIAQGMEPFEAAAAAAHLHGAAADLLATRMSIRAMLPTDALQALPELFSIYEETVI